MNTFTKTEVFLSVFVQKRSSVNGAYVSFFGANRNITDRNFDLLNGCKIQNHVHINLNRQMVGNFLANDSRTSCLRTRF